MKFEITLEQAQEIATYLQTQPFIHVEHLINILRALKPIDPKSGEQKPKLEEVKNV